MSKQLKKLFFSPFEIEKSLVAFILTPIFNIVPT